jgi:probable HAF family extracellular repeat protein
MHLSGCQLAERRQYGHMNHFRIGDNAGKIHMRQVANSRALMAANANQVAGNSSSQVICAIIPEPMISRSFSVAVAALFFSALAPAQIRLIDRARLQPGPAVPLPQRGFLGKNFNAGRHLSRKTGPFLPGQGLALPHWTSSFNYRGTTFATTALGTEPSLGQTTVIPTVIVPYRLVFADGTVLDATTDVVDGVTPVDGVRNSPIFQKIPWNSGPTQLGTTQWGDAVLRANFWSIHSDSGQGYHVLLSAPSVAPVVVINVPPDRGITLLDPSNNRFGVVDFEWLADLTANETFALGIGPQQLPIHLFSSLRAQDLSGGTSGGFHWSINVSTDPSTPVLQTFIQTSYFGANSFFTGANRPEVANVGILAHEIAEWLNDPAGDDFVPAWQDPALSSTCDNSLLEVGDPLELISHGLQASSGGRTYNFPDIAFLPWFSQTQNSLSANGWFSFLNNFASPSTTCPVFTTYAYGSLDFIGVDSTVLTGLNNNQQAVGYITVGPALGSFLLNNFDPILGGVLTVSPIYVPGSLVTVASKINDAGNVVGVYLDAKGTTHGFLFSNGQYSNIDFPGAIGTEALGINNKNNFDVVGDYTDARGVTHGFLLRGSNFSTIDAPFAVNSAVTAINDSEKIVGTYDTGGAVTGGFAGTPGAVSPLNFPSATNFGGQTVTTLLNSLNNKDEIVGMETTAFEDLFGAVSETKAFLEGGGNFEPSSIGIDDALFAQYLGNNQSGIVVGSVQDLTGNHALFAVPASLVSNIPFASIKLAVLPGLLH